ncbi:MAG: hypothetical protein M1829_000150 [Trizodia sp. TS-e1964]|nr:MAG: hypothetical protein M1829_000150 [Trizodia sp. TS-e1964]
MYWPTGTPKIYASRSLHNLGSNISHSEDNADSFRSRNEVEDGENRADTESNDSSKENTSAQLPDSLEQDSKNHPNRQRQLPQPAKEDNAIVGVRVARNGQMFATITLNTLTIWQTRPTAVLASVIRSAHSVKTYGHNTSLLLRPDSAIFVVQTNLGYLITYTLATDPNTRVYKPSFVQSSSTHSKRQSFVGTKGLGSDRTLLGPGEGGGVREVSIQFRMVIRIDAGISKALALDDELVVATEKPPAIQCIRWTPDSSGAQTSNELLNRMSWISKKTAVTEMVHDRPMNLSAWITSDGMAYAVQRVSEASPKVPEAQKKLFRGYCFHRPGTDSGSARKVAINARFSLIAVACLNGNIYVYSARDYAGNIPLSHKLYLDISTASSGQIQFLTYSPDGYCLFAGYEKGWMTWSVYGKPGGSSFVADKPTSDLHREGWLLGVRDGSWLAGGAEILLLGQNDDRIWVVEMARCSVVGCFSSANLSRTLLQTNTGLMIYRGYDAPNLTAISAESTLWHQTQIPPGYLVDQWPIRSSVISFDGRYVAVAGRRGLAHYSVNSGRWKTFTNSFMENEFAVRGGMCWHQHILIAAVEADDRFELRLFSRELALDSSLLLHTEVLSAPVVLLAQSSEDSILVYTYENILFHFVIDVRNDSIQLILAGQIAFHGIVRAPARVRGLSWIIPDKQYLEGDPSKDVTTASVLFLVDGKLVLLQPSTTEGGELKYDMRVIAQNVEYYALMRDQPPLPTSNLEQDIYPNSALTTNSNGISQGSGLRDSLWVFDGNDMRVWTDIQDILRQASIEMSRELPSSILVPVDFYPLSTLLSKGILLGVDPDLVQRRDINFAFFRLSIRTQLFLPQLLRHYLSQFNSPAAFHLSHHYQSLPYFSHALEVLLHDVLDDEVDRSPTPENSLLPAVISFLSSFPDYLDILVQCTRKTEVRSWRTLFAYLPPAQELFEESLQQGLLKTAGGYLLILHNFEELASSSPQLIRLLAKAKEEEDWDLCKELARFLTALDESGVSLREALEMVDLGNKSDASKGENDSVEGARLKVPSFQSKSRSPSVGLESTGALNSSRNRSPSAGTASDGSVAAN